MTLKRISNQPGRGSAGKVIYGDNSLGMANQIAGLRAAINPATLRNETIGSWSGGPFEAIQGRDLVSGLVISSATSVTYRDPADDDYNGKPSIVFWAENGDLAINGLGSTPAFSYIFQAVIDPVRLAVSNAIGVLVSTYYDSDVRSFIRWENASMRFRMTPEENVSQNVKFSANNSVPTDGLAHLYAWTFNGTNTMSLWLDGVKIYTATNMTGAPLDDPTASVFIGTQYSTVNSAHVGSMGKWLCFDTAIDITDPTRFVAESNYLLQEIA